MIQFNGVNKWFGKLHVLKDIDLQVAAGEVVVICGPQRFGQVNPDPLHQPPGEIPERGAVRGRHTAA